MRYAWYVAAAIFGVVLLSRSIPNAPPKLDKTGITVSTDRAERQRQSARNMQKGDGVLSLELLTSWVESDLTGLISWYAENASGELLHLQARHLIVERLLAFPPETAFSLLDETLHKDLILSLIEKWAQRDVDIATDALRLFKNQEQTIKEVTTHWCRTDASAAEQWLAALPELPGKEAALEEARARAAVQKIKGRWSILAPEAATRWAESLPESVADEEIAVHLASIWTKRSPERAADYVGNLRPGPTRNEAALEVVSTWAATEPARAAAWVEQFPNGDVRKEAINRVLNFWMPADPLAATAWHAATLKY